jgi:ribosome-binding factor A
MSRRMGRVNELLREELSILIQRELKDPRIEALVSVTSVDTSQDLAHAKVFVSVMAPPPEQRTVLRGLDSASSFMRRSLRERVKLRRIPELTFSLDTSIAEGTRVLELIEQLREESEGRR